MCLFAFKGTVRVAKCCGAIPRKTQKLFSHLPFNQTLVFKAWLSEDGGRDEDVFARMIIQRLQCERGGILGMRKH